MEPVVYDSDQLNKHELEAYIIVSGEWYRKSGILKAQTETKKCMAFLDKVIAECKKKFPEVKVNW